MYVVENWFDYEIGSKIPLSLLESQFNEEMDNFNKILEAIDVCNENNIIVSIDENAITDIVDKLIEKIKPIIANIKKRIGEIKDKIVKFMAKAKNNKDKDDFYIPTIRIYGVDNNDKEVDIKKGQCDIILNEILNDIQKLTNLDQLMNEKLNIPYSIAYNQASYEFIDESEFVKTNFDTFTKTIDSLSKASNDATKILTSCIDILSKFKLDYIKIKGSEENVKNYTKTVVANTRYLMLFAITIDKAATRSILYMLADWE